MSILASRLPMRNWNKLRASCQIRTYSASRLPMRNWNWSVIRLPGLLYGCASRLPMRNWNVDVGGTMNVWRGFQTTYEELKRFGSKIYGVIRFCFQTTYEELKQLRNGWRTSHDIASRLPMRNWNWSVIRLPGLLYGCASRLPMRNWNVDVGGTMNVWRGFQTTYEELKRFGSKIYGVIRFCFQTTYEELKQLRNGWRTSHDIASRLPMRNWNSVFAWLMDQVRASFQTTYEELKQMMVV